MAELQVSVIPVRFDNKTYDQPGQVVSNCNSITFINYGTADCTIDYAITLAQNQSISFSGNVGEFTDQQFTVQFGTGTFNLVVIRKIYNSLSYG
jgi:hypothetical protein